MSLLWSTDMKTAVMKLLVNNYPNLHKQPCYFSLNNIPNHIILSTKISMSEYITQPGNLTPLNLWVGRLHLWGNLFKSFTDNL